MLYFFLCLQSCFLPLDHPVPFFIILLWPISTSSVAGFYCIDDSLDLYCRRCLVSYFKLLDMRLLSWKRFSYIFSPWWIYSDQISLYTHIHKHKNPIFFSSWEKWEGFRTESFSLENILKIIKSSHNLPQYLSRNTLLFWRAWLASCSRFFYEWLLKKRSVAACQLKGSSAQSFIVCGCLLIPHSPHLMNLL